MSGLVARARLYERIVHDSRPWRARVQGADCCVFVPLERHERDDRIVLNGYLHAPLRAATMVEVWSGEDMIMCTPLVPAQDGPFRITLALAAEDAELAA